MNGMWIRMCVTVFLLVLTVFALTSIVQADDPIEHILVTGMDLTDLSLEELMNIEITLGANNVLEDQQLEFNPGSVLQTVPSDVPRSAYARLHWKF